MSPLLVGRYCYTAHWNARPATGHSLDAMLAFFTHWIEAGNKASAVVIAIVLNHALQTVISTGLPAHSTFCVFFVSTVSSERAALDACRADTG